MDLIDNNADIFDLINPPIIEKYLLDNGWRKEEKINGRSIVLSTHNKAGEKFSIMLPLDKTIPDFSYRMAEVFKVLEVFDRHLYLKLLSTFTESNSY